MNIFYKLKDFNSFFSLNVGIFDENEAINKFRFLELNEYPYYLRCEKCNIPPEIELKGYEEINISCSNCKLNSNEKIKNIVNYSSNWVTNAIKYCSFKHEKKIPSIIFCKNHNLFLCNECLKFHQDNTYLSQKMKLAKASFNDREKCDFKSEGEDIIINFMTKEGQDLSFRISCKTPLNEALKKFAKIINLPDYLMDELIFITNGFNLDNKSEISLEKLKIINAQKILVVKYFGDNHQIIKFLNLKKDICIIHNKKLTLNCYQCNMEICNQCMENHKSHSIEKLEIKHSFYK